MWSMSPSDQQINHVTTKYLPLTVSNSKYISTQTVTDWVEILTNLKL